MSLLNRIKVILIILISFFSSIEIFAQADYGSTIEVIYSNLNIINNSIFTIKNQMKNLEGSVQKQLRNQKNILDENSNNIKVNTQEIASLKSEMQIIDTAYQKVLQNYESIIANMDELDYKILRVDSSFVDMSQELDDLRNKFIFLTTEYLDLKNKFARIPDIMFCQNCKPKLFFGLTKNLYLYDPKSDIAVQPSFSTEAGYNYNNNFTLWLNYNSPIFITVSEDDIQSFKISDEWKTNIFSFGFSYNLLEGSSPRAWGIPSQSP